MSTKVKVVRTVTTVELTAARARGAAEQERRVLDCPALR